MNMRAYVVAALGLIGGCSDGGDEVARLSSPDGRHEGVVIEQSGGATTSYWYDVCVVPSGARCDPTAVRVVLYAALRNSQAYGVNLKWIDSSGLVIEYESAKRVQRKALTPGSSSMVRVDLKAGVVDPVAPPGSMRRSVTKGTSE
jgi:hypothetical protein